MNILKPTELYTLKGCTLWHVNYFSMKKTIIGSQGICPQIFAGVYTDEERQTKN